MDNYYNLYVSSTLALARTMAVKFSQAAFRINTALVEKEGADALNAQDPTTWRYYQNMSGTYHVSDTRMEVVCLDNDDGQVIEFNQTNLARYPITQTYYQYGSRYYNDLVARYPDQEHLILAILYAPRTPNYIQEVIDAPDGTLLYYKPDLIEIQEYDLLYKTQIWAQSWYARWVTQAYIYVDDLYIASVISRFYSELVCVLFNERLKACKTNQAHSYHIRQYLMSHGMLDKYIELLTLEQSLFLYRNIEYIEHNSGMRGIFEWLVDNILTKRDLPLYAITMRHDTSRMLDAENPQGYLRLDPEVIFTRKPVNASIASNTQAWMTLPQLQFRMNERPLGNYAEHYYRGEHMLERFEASPSNVVGTKVYECVAEDPLDASPYTLEVILINHLFYWISTGKYHTRVEFTLPGYKQSIFVSVKDALILYLYLLLKSNETPIKKLPVIPVYRVLRESRLSIEEMKKFIDPRFIADDRLQMVLDLTPTVGEITSVEQFYRTIEELHRATVYSFSYEYTGMNEYACGDLRNCLENQYVNLQISLTDEDLDAWLGERSLDFSKYSTTDAYNASTVIMKALTGAEVYQSTSIKKVQKAMLEIMRTLCSYSIYFIGDITTSDTKRVRNYTPFVLETSSNNTDFVSGELPFVEPKGWSEVSNDTMAVDLKPTDWFILPDMATSVSQVTLPVVDVVRHAETFTVPHWVETPFMMIQGFRVLD